jgi:hypothetical protein
MAKCLKTFTMMLFWQNNSISIEMNKFQVWKFYHIQWCYNNFQIAREFVEKKWCCWRKIACKEEWLSTFDKKIKVLELNYSTTFSHFASCSDFKFNNVHKRKTCFFKPKPYAFYISTFPLLASFSFPRLSRFKFGGKWCKGMHWK